MDDLGPDEGGYDCGLGDPMSEKPRRIPRHRDQDRGHKRKPCKDCIARGLPPTRDPKYPGPRCASHHREFRAEKDSADWGTRMFAKYGLTVEQYWEIYEYQGRKCFICMRATGARKKLSVDHCHKTGQVRGLLCLGCNRNVLGHLRDDVEALERAIDYLTFHPASMAGVNIITPDMMDEERKPKR